MTIPAISARLLTVFQTAKTYQVECSSCGDLCSNTLIQANAKEKMRLCPRCVEKLRAELNKLAEGK